MKPRWKKGMILMQTLVMSVLLSMIAVMLMKWVLARYMMAARNFRSTTATARTVGYSQKFMSSWNIGAAAPACGATIDGQAISCNSAVVGLTNRVKMNVNED